MAITRHATGSSRPRVFEAAPATTTTRKRATKPKAKATTTGRVSKTKAPATHHRRKPTLADKVKGATKKVVGAVEGKPGKKAAGTAEMRGHDGKRKRAAPKKKVVATV